jgi:hypothetical protein
MSHTMSPLKNLAAPSRLLPNYPSAPAPVAAPTAPPCAGLASQAPMQVVQAQSARARVRFMTPIAPAKTSRKRALDHAENSGLSVTIARFRAEAPTSPSPEAATSKHSAAPSSPTLFGLRKKAIARLTDKRIHPKELASLETVKRSVKASLANAPEWQLVCLSSDVLEGIN